MTNFISGNFHFGRPEFDPDKVWLSSSFRVLLIKQGIEKAGSINKLGRELGYRSRVHPGWSIRQILIGYQAFPLDRLTKMAEFLGLSIEEILRHRTKSKAITIESTKDALMRNGLYCYYPR